MTVRMPADWEVRFGPSSESEGILTAWKGSPEYGSDFCTQKTLVVVVHRATWAAGNDASSLGPDSGSGFTRGDSFPCGGVQAIIGRSVQVEVYRGDRVSSEALAEAYEILNSMTID